MNITALVFCMVALLALACQLGPSPGAFRSAGGADGLAGVQDMRAHPRYSWPEPGVAEPGVAEPARLFYHSDPLPRTRNFFGLLCEAKGYERAAEPE